MTDPHGTVTVLVPEGKQASDLKLRELDIASRKLGTDVLTCMVDREDRDGNPLPASPLRYAALVQIAWLWAKRTDPAAKVETFADYEFDELRHALGMDRKPVEPEGDEDEDPSQPSDESGTS